MTVGGGSMQLPGDKSLMEKFIKSLANLAISRAQITAESLLTKETGSGNVREPCAVSFEDRLCQTSYLSVQTKESKTDYHCMVCLQISLGLLAADVTDQVLEDHIDLCFGQHLSVVVACR